MILTRFLEIVSFTFPVMEPEHIEDNIDFAKRTLKNPVRDDGLVKKIQVGEICWFTYIGCMSRSQAKINLVRRGWKLKQPKMMKDCKAIRLPHKKNSQLILGSCNWQTIFAAYIWSTYRMMEPNEDFSPKKGWSNNSAIFFQLHVGYNHVMNFRVFALKESTSNDKY